MIRCSKRNLFKDMRRLSIHYPLFIALRLRGGAVLGLKTTKNWKSARPVVIKLTILTRHELVYLIDRQFSEVNFAIVLSLKGKAGRSYLRKEKTEVRLNIHFVDKLTRSGHETSFGNSNNSGQGSSGQGLSLYNVIAFQ